MTDSGSLRGTKPDEAASVTSQGSLNAAIGVSLSGGAGAGVPGINAGGCPNLLSRIKAAQERGQLIRRVMIGGTRGI